MIREVTQDAKPEEAGMDDGKPRHLRITASSDLTQG